VGPLDPMPEKVIQFGEGNFLRAFVDWMINRLNRKGLFHGSVVVVQPIEQGIADVLNEQDGLYTLYLRGLQDGSRTESREVITSISRAINPYREYSAFLECAHNPDLRYMVSNTTEAGIAYVPEDQPKSQCPKSFPAKAAAFLYERYRHFSGDPSKGMRILPCELVNDNGTELKKGILQYCRDWDLEDGFRDWLEKECSFYNTLVDRIATGYPREEAEEMTQYLGYEDQLIDTGEVFHLWVIEGDPALEEELPFQKAGLHVVRTDNQLPYRKRKVRILNGAHTMMVPAAFLYGFDTVKECVENPVTGGLMRKGIFEEVIPVLDLPQEETGKFAEEVLERFANPYIRHMLLGITLNCVSKYRVRVLPSLLEYIRQNKKQNNKIPSVLSFSLAALIVFYRSTRLEGDRLIGMRDEKPYPIRDDLPVLKFFAKVWEEYDRFQDPVKLTHEVLARKDFWGKDLSEVQGLEDAVAHYLSTILVLGVQKATEAVL